MALTSHIFGSGYVMLCHLRLPSLTPNSHHAQYLFRARKRWRLYFPPILRNRHLNSYCVLYCGSMYLISSHLSPKWAYQGKEVEEANSFSWPERSNLAPSIYPFFLRPRKEGFRHHFIERDLLLLLWKSKQATHSYLEPILFFPATTDALMYSYLRVYLVYMTCHLNHAWDYTLRILYL